MLNEEDKLTCIIRTRVSKPRFDRLEKLRKQSNVRTMAEFVRAVLQKEKINWYHRNAEMESLALEFAFIRKELNAIGKNINQITRFFHQASTGQKMVQAIKAEGEYHKVEIKVNELIRMMEQVTTKWLRK